MTVQRNADGLTLKYGVDQGNTGTTGSPVQAGPFKEIVALIEYQHIPAFGTTAMVDQIPGTFIPAGAIIESYEFVVTTAFTGTGATLTVGLYSEDGTTAVDATGIINAAALTTINAIGKILTTAGTSVATSPIVTSSQLSVLAGTASFTAGAGQLRVRYFVPRSSGNPN
jgi:hypothetical protein